MDEHFLKTTIEKNEKIDPIEKLLWRLVNKMIIVAMEELSYYQFPFTDVLKG